ncbi:hypothetical protein BMS3Bbin12_01472 [bacterium BMS3Bbin12]|nr:hypothetical protein BMS3Abin12_00158 [bacterium BMS3Abin12]GBE48295.1 hypothetical protein BMS3Bbin12_01472 [bacterium BMS3Bbin12]GBE50804.1 hypothetical protein BMS3Bbin13_01750 [bacterium BMS3Bbin13]HDJ85827.1 DUF2066 domain-containing protein [Chromatiales bacterium]
MHILRRRCASARVAGTLVLLAIALPASARMVRDLYTVQQPVNGQGVSERLAAFRSGLAEVFVRISGDAQVAGDPKLRVALQDPARFVLEYRYEQAPPAVAPASPQAAPASTQVPSASTQAAPASTQAPSAPAQAPPESAQSGGSNTVAAGMPPALRLWMRFDPDAVRIILQQAALPVWGSARPTTLIWLAVEDGMQRSIVGENEQSPLERALVKVASQRGIAVLLPLMDLEDERRLSFGDLWGGFAAPVRAASARYGTHAVLVGRIRHGSGGEWRARWTLYVGNHTARWRSGADTEAQLLGFGINGLADRLAAQFAVPAGDTARSLVRIEVNGVRSLKAYARVRAYLRRLNPVLHVQTFAVRTAQADFRLEIRGDIRVLKQAIGLGRILAPGGAGPASPGPPPAGVPTVGGPASETGAAGTLLVYRLVP